MQNENDICGPILGMSTLQNKLAHIRRKENKTQTNILEVVTAMKDNEWICPLCHELTTDMHSCPKLKDYWLEHHKKEEVIENGSHNW